MMRATVMLMAVGLMGCVAARTGGPVVVTSRGQVEKHVGERVTLRGVVTNTKMATIVGVDVASDDPDLRGRAAEATGMLQRYVVTAESLAAREENGMRVANRGPGVFYRLRAMDSDADAAVRPVR